MVEAPKVSVIIPVFNCEEFLTRCLDSVFQQTFQDFEVIAVNDGSTDGSLAILNEYAARYPRMSVLDQANAGQGAARNRALGEALGEYVLFVDADDFIESVLLQVTVERAEKDQADLVHFDWKLYQPSPDRKSPYLYYNVDRFWHNYTLQGAECDELLRVQNFYCVTKLYRRSFLNLHAIRFEMGRIYEDNPFVVHAVNRAELVSLVHKPFYVVNPRIGSTTRVGAVFQEKYMDHVHALRRSLQLLTNRYPYAKIYLLDYHLRKFENYKKRLNVEQKKKYLDEIIYIYNKEDIKYHEVNSSPLKKIVKIKLHLLSRRMNFAYNILTKVVSDNKHYRHLINRNTKK